MFAHDTKPVFPQGTTATAYRNDGGEWVISFTEAETYFIVHEYQVTITDQNGRIIHRKNYVDDYFVIDDDNTADVRIGADTLESGKTYNLCVVAESAYHKHSTPLKLTFTAQ